jgi:6-pyruvoyltetrahydropterin/6-carboxytetrahydropterin synthase
MSGLVSVTKAFKFSAAHRLPDDPGLCSSTHGHTYTAEVTAVGPVRDDGMVIHFDDLKAAWDRLEPMLDHCYLNDTLPDEAQPPTTEKVAAWLLGQLHRANPLIVGVTLWEGPTSRASAALVVGA